MKYLSNEPMLFANSSKDYRDNYDLISWEGKEFVNIEVEIGEEEKEFIQRYADENKLTFEIAAGKIIEEGLKLLDEQITQTKGDKDE